jgi:Uma2 family endonuclease
MSSPSNPQVPRMPTAEGDLWRLSVDRYNRMIESGIITPDDRVELLEGALVNKMSKSPPHRIANKKVRDALEAILPQGWYLDAQEPITLDDSQPEPDAAVIRGRTEDYTTRHPQPAEIALVVEVADSSLRRDREDKRRIYARNGIAVYWIVNVADRLIDVFTDPSGPVLTPDYANTATYRPGDVVPVIIAGANVGTVNVSDLLP